MTTIRKAIRSAVWLTVATLVLLGIGALAGWPVLTYIWWPIVLCWLFVVSVLLGGLAGVVLRTWQRG